MINDVTGEEGRLRGPGGQYLDIMILNRTRFNAEKSACPLQENILRRGGGGAHTDTSCRKFLCFDSYLP